MKVAIHQPHYFPWMGYLDKMAKANLFIILDQVQLTSSTNMYRNRFLTSAGKERYLTVPFEKKGYMEKEFRNVLLNQQIDWQEKHKNFIFSTYKKMTNFAEIWPLIKPVFEKHYETVYQVSMDTIEIVRKIFGITTPMVLQSELEWRHDAKKNDLILALCEATGANIYLSGNGARKYMDIVPFEQAGIRVVYQDFTYPHYQQKYSDEFVANLSSLDMLFNCGIEQSRRIFWDNVKSTNEFGE